MEQTPNYNFPEQSKAQGRSSNPHSTNNGRRKRAEVARYVPPSRRNTSSPSDSNSGAAPHGDSVLSNHSGFGDSTHTTSLTDDMECDGNKHFDNVDVSDQTSAQKKDKKSSKEQKRRKEVGVYVPPTKRKETETKVSEERSAENVTTGRKSRPAHCHKQQTKIKNINEETHICTKELLDSEVSENIDSEMITDKTSIENESQRNLCELSLQADSLTDDHSNVIQAATVLPKETKKYTDTFDRDSSVSKVLVMQQNSSDNLTSSICTGSEECDIEEDIRVKKTTEELELGSHMLTNVSPVTESADTFVDSTLSTSFLNANKCPDFQTVAHSKDGSTFKLVQRDIELDSGANNTSSHVSNVPVSGNLGMQPVEFSTTEIDENLGTADTEEEQDSICLGKHLNEDAEAQFESTKIITNVLTTDILSGSLDNVNSVHTDMPMLSGKLNGQSTRNSNDTQTILTFEVKSDETEVAIPDIKNMNEVRSIPECAEVSEDKDTSIISSSYNSVSEMENVDKGSVQESDINMDSTSADYQGDIQMAEDIVSQANVKIDNRTDETIEKKNEKGKTNKKEKGAKMSKETLKKKEQIQSQSLLENTDEILDSIFTKSTVHEHVPKSSHKKVKIIDKQAEEKISIGKNMGTQHESDVEESWEDMFDDSGECLDETLMDELTTAVGKVKVQHTQFDYLSYQSKDPELDSMEYGHLIEIYDFPADFKTGDILSIFSPFMDRGFDIKWVDDTHAIGIFSSAVAAEEAIHIKHPQIKVHPIAMATRQSKMKAKRCTEFLQPYKPRPETTASAARRLVTGALGLRTKVSKDKRDLERHQLREAKEKRKSERRQKQDAWDGSYGKCAMDDK